MREVCGLAGTCFNKTGNVILRRFRATTVAVEKQYYTTCVCVQACACMCVQVCVRMGARACACADVRMYVRVCMCARACGCECACVRARVCGRVISSSRDFYLTTY